MTETISVLVLGLGTAAGGKSISMMLLPSVILRIYRIYPLIGRLNNVAGFCA